MGSSSILYSGNTLINFNFVGFDCPHKSTLLCPISKGGSTCPFHPCHLLSSDRWKCALCVGPLCPTQLMVTPLLLLSSEDNQLYIVLILMTVVVYDPHDLSLRLKIPARYFITHYNAFPSLETVETDENLALNL